MNTERNTISAINAMSAHFPHRKCRAPSLLLALLSLALMLPVRQAGGQGTVHLDNRIPGGTGVGLTLHIWGPSASAPSLALAGLGSNDSPSGTTPFGSASSMFLIGVNGSGGQYGYATTFAQLIGAVGANQPENDLVPLGQTATFRSGSLLGAVAGITDTLSAVSPYATTIPADAPAATFEIVAWDNSSGLYPTWVQASVAWNGGQIYAGHSAPFTVTNIGGSINSPLRLPRAERYHPVRYSRHPLQRHAQRRRQSERVPRQPWLLPVGHHDQLWQYEQRLRTGGRRQPRSFLLLGSIFGARHHLPFQGLRILPGRARRRSRTGLRQ